VRVLAGIALVVLAVGLAALELAQVLPGQDPPQPGQQLRKEFSQDFRGRRPLHPALTLIGPDAEDTARLDIEGLRIPLPANRPVKQAVGLATTFALVGDFEFTVAYELFSATQPTSGYGVGVALNVADNEQRTKFAKVGRGMVVKGGSVFMTESWNNQLK